MASALQQAFSRNAFKDALARERSKGLRTTLDLIKKEGQSRALLLRSSTPIIVYNSHLKIGLGLARC